MSNETPEQTVALSDLSARKVREENPQVASEFDRLEDQVEDLQSEKAEAEADKAELEEKVERLESEKDELAEAHEDELSEVEEDYEEQISELEEELQAREEIIEEIRENERSEALDRLREARAQLNDVDPEEVDVSSFEDSDPSQISEVASDLEQAVERMSSPTSASSREEDIRRDTSGSNGSDGGNLDEERKREIARDMGVLDQWEGADELAPQGFQVSADGDVEQ